MSVTIPTAVGTGIGSMPGTDPREAASIINGELDFAYLAELPARGVGADVIGRMAAILVDMPMDAGTWGYRLSGRRSNVSRRAADFLSADLDAVEELWDAAGFIRTGRPFKIQVCGPFTFAASAELLNGHRILRDRGAWSDVIASATEGIRVLVTETERRLGTNTVVQLDEPSIGAVLDGTVKPLTRFDTIPAIPVIEVAEALTQLVEAIERPVILHNCGAPRWDLTARLPGVAVSCDITSWTGESAADLDGVGALIDRGDVFIAGAVPSTPPRAASDTGSASERVASALARLIDRIGLNRSVLRESVVVTPACGLAGADSVWSSKALAVTAKAGELLSADPDAL